MVKNLIKKLRYSHKIGLFHLSVGICFSFVVIVLALSLSMNLFKAAASTLTTSDSVNLTAVVGGISPGPISTGGSGGSGVGSTVPTPTPTTSVPPSPTATPFINVYAEPKGQIESRNINISGRTNTYDVFIQPYPMYSGESSYPNKLLYIKIQSHVTFNSTVLTDENGNWKWSSPTGFNNGNYTLTITGYDLNRSLTVTRYFTIEQAKISPTPTPVQQESNAQPNNSSGISNGTALLPPQTPLQNISDGNIFPTPLPTPKLGLSEIPFGINIKILPENKKIKIGEKIYLTLTLTGSKNNHNKTQKINYIIKNDKGEIILESSDGVTFENNETFTKILYTAPGTKPGLYTVVVESTFKNITSVSSDTLELIDNLEIATANTKHISNKLIYWSAFFSILFFSLLFAVVSYVSGRGVTKKFRNGKN